eukprot:99692_1
MVWGGTEGLPGKDECVVRVSTNRLGRVFLCFVEEVEVMSDNRAPSSSGSFHSTIALDPGIRTFQPMYDADGFGIEWDEGGMKNGLCYVSSSRQLSSLRWPRRGSRGPYDMRIIAS